jgi:hypothetical protein
MESQKILHEVDKMGLEVNNQEREVKFMGLKLDNMKNRGWGSISRVGRSITWA